MEIGLWIKPNIIFPFYNKLRNEASGTNNFTQSKIVDAVKLEQIVSVSDVN